MPYTFSTATVTIGNSTKKADYDRLLTDNRHIKSGTCTFYGPKIFTSTVAFNSATTFKKKSTFTATSIFTEAPIFTATAIFNVRPKYYMSSDNALGILHSLTPSSASYSFKSTSLRSATCSSKVPIGTKAIYILGSIEVSSGQAGNIDIYSSSSTSIWQGMLKQAAGTLAGAADTKKTLMIRLDSNRKFYYKASQSGYTSTVNFYYMGFYI